MGRVAVHRSPTNAIFSAGFSTWGYPQVIHKP